MHKPVRKAVIAAAGFGTRFLPQTKAMPKEMLPLGNKPVIQYIVEDLVAAGVTDIIIVSGYSKRAIEDHFDVPNEDLLRNLRAGGNTKTHYIEELHKISDMANFAYVRQKGPYGTGTPIMNAAHLIGDEPFIYTFADDLTVAEPNSFKQMVDLYNEFDANIMSCVDIGASGDHSRYGIISGDTVRDGVMKANAVIEKPKSADAPSNFASIGSFVFTPDIFNYIENGLLQVPKGDEFWATNYIYQPMMDDSKPFYACEIKNSIRYDTGTPLEYLKTAFDFALKQDDTGPKLKEYLRKKLQ